MYRERGAYFYYTYVYGTMTISANLNIRILVIVYLEIHSPLSTDAQGPTTQLMFYNSTTQIPHNNRIAPPGITVLLECRVTPHQQQIHYQWTCPHPPCDGEYRKVYNNLILIVATITTSGRYKCTPTPNGKEDSATLAVQTSLPQGKCNILYNLFPLYYATLAM